MAGNVCDTCGESPTVGVAASSLGPVSFAWCFQCLHNGAEPYSQIVYAAWATTGRDGAIDPYMEEVLIRHNNRMLMVDGGETHNMDQLRADMQRFEVEYSRAASDEAELAHEREEGDNG